ncbi:MAG TPA: hypothetical protein VD926_01415 [Acidimicrobiales bacterium]|nr:hypothetical protein [Acidimicrobiales bacterium]
MSRRLLLVALVVAGWAAVAIPVRATYNARVTADEPQYLLSAISLGEDLDLDISDEIRDRAYEPFHEVTIDRQTEPNEDGREFSPHDPLLPVILAVPMVLGGWVAAKATLAVLAGALAALLLWLAVERFGVARGPATVVVLAFSLSAPLTSYGTQVYPELPAALAVALGIAALTGPLARRGQWLLVAAVVALPWLSVKYAPVAAVLVLVGGWRLWRRSARDDVLRMAAVLAVAGIAYLAVHWAVYGGWTVYASGDHFQSGGEFTVTGGDPEYPARTQRLIGLLVDRGFGLAAWAPVFLAAVPALGALARRRPDHWPVLALPLAAGWANATWLALTMHGWWWPGRQVVVVLPCVVLATAWWVGTLADHRSGRAQVSWRTHARDQKRVVRAIAGLGAVGMVLWGWLVREVLQERLRLIIDFESTRNPLYRGWRTVLPDLRVPDGTTAFVYAAWVLVLAGLAWWGWRSAGPSAGRDEDAGAGERADADRPAVDVQREGAVG